MAFCTGCGTEAQPQARFCGRCGLVLAPPAAGPAVPESGSAHTGVTLPAVSGSPAPDIQVPSAAPRNDVLTYEEQIAAARERLDELRQELESVEEAVEIQSFGFYRPRYGLESSEEYTTRLKQCRAEQQQRIKDGSAVEYPSNWMLDGSMVKGKEMLREHAKLMLRAFNGECDAAIGKVSYSNVLRLEQRIENSSTAINKLGEAKKTRITDGYRDLKLAELYLVHEHREKVHQEKEEQRQIKEQMREEQRAQKEIEEAQKNAEKEEERYRGALEKARLELAESTDAQHAKLESLVAKLESELSEAIDRKAKSIARAQLTRSGHVYVLSNVGSFGAGVYKIGMTRRFEPLERVYELGDASVPFRFDVHAMIYCEDAPALEDALHKEFADRRINKVNLRREYFRVSLEEIHAAIAKHHGTVTFVTVPEAEEYRKTLAMAEDLGSSEDDASA